ncbi:CLUMA_CG000876, isoform A [Clunio marinus]|uniref:CLUMA_CG000876, isoform A n=1 Tax=Clunio marinus TaxID=568069 RepID=A0A1J1HKT9_9DIPT|nr:CLUMA_CG000876, isoform A [Clunio marinus]
MVLQFWFMFFFISISVVFSTSEKCFNICPDIIPYDIVSPIREIALENLIRSGPSDGVCLTRDKFIFNGTQFGLPPKCVCLNIPKGEDITPENGPICPNLLKGSIEETIDELSIRNYELLGDDAPEDGWCPEGKTKWILESTLVNIPRNACICIDAFDWYSPEVVCIESD